MLSHLKRPQLDPPWGVAPPFDAGAAGDIALNVGCDHNKVPTGHFTGILLCGGQYGDSPLSTSSTWRLGWRSWCLSSFWCLAGSPAGAASVAPSCLVKSLQTFSRHEIESQCGHNSRAPADVKISDFLRKKLFSAVTHHNWFQCNFLKKEHFLIPMARCEMLRQELFS